ncbi:MAG: hypothetical protein ACI9MR_000729, partial [Myxococcota bacterium]
FGGTALEDVTIIDGTGATLLTAARIETDISLIDGLLGQRRPTRVRIKDAAIDVAVIDGQLRGIKPPAKQQSDSDPDADKAGAIEVVLEGVDVTMRGSHGPYRVDPIALSELTGILVRDTSRQVHGKLAGRILSGGHTSELTAQIAPSGGIDLKLATGAIIGIHSPHGPVWVGARGLHRDPDTGKTSVDGLGIRRGDEHLTVQTLVALDAPGRFPDPFALKHIEVDDAKVTARGATLLAGHAEVRFDPGTDDNGFAGLPLPTEVSASGIGAQTKSGRLSGTFDDATITLGDFAAAMLAGNPLDAVAEVRLGRPRIRAKLADLGAVPGMARLAGLQNPSDPDIPEATPQDLEDPGPGATKRPDPAPKTPATPHNDAAASVDGLLSGTRRAKIMTLIALLKRWNIAISDGIVDVRGPDDKPILALEGLSFSTSEVGEDLLEIQLAAKVLRGSEERAKVDVDIGVDAEGTPVYVNGRISGRDLAYQASRFWDRIDVEPESQVALTFNYERPIAPEAPHRVKGEAKLSDFTFEWWRVADAPVKGLEAEVSFDLAFYPAQHRVVLDLPKIQFGEAKLTGAFDVTRPPGQKPRFDARFSMPSQDCGAMARSIPAALIPRLSGLSMRGRMDFDARLTLDLNNPRDLELAVKGNTDACRVLRLGPHIDLGALKRDFVHRPTEPGKGLRYKIRVGRGTREWIPSHKLPEMVKTQAWVTEDRRYFDHGGVRWDLIERALKIDLENGRFVYGGSTITQQLVKNLYLDRGKTLARKLEEAIISWQMERVLDKDEILTLYVNLIEYGPDIYGIKHAARFYFNKAVDDLDALEIAFIMGLKPYPSKGYRQWQKGKLAAWWVRRVEHVLGMVSRRSALLTPVEALDYAPFQPVFRAENEPISPHLMRRISPDPAPDEDGGWDPWKEEEGD